MFIILILSNFISIYIELSKFNSIHSSTMRASKEQPRCIVDVTYHPFHILIVEEKIVEESIYKSCCDIYYVFIACLG